jgi:hypothetical protein
MSEGDIVSRLRHLRVVVGVKGGSSAKLEAPGRM